MRCRKVCCYQDSYNYIIIPCFDIEPGAKKCISFRITTAAVSHSFEIIRKGFWCVCITSLKMVCLWTWKETILQYTDQKMGSDVYLKWSKVYSYGSTQTVPGTINETLTDYNKLGGIWSKVVNKYFYKRTVKMSHIVADPSIHAQNFVIRNYVHWKDKFINFSNCFVRTKERKSL